MLASFSTALSALTADETAINVVGNNLANLNTPGFKDTVVSFSDLVTQSLGEGSCSSPPAGTVGAVAATLMFWVLVNVLPSDAVTVSVAVKLPP